jgi:transposase
VELEKVVIALLYMLRAGCPWRDLPCVGMSWRTVYGYFAHWRDTGLWQSVFKTLTKGCQGPMFSVDSTYVRVNRSGANPTGGQSAQAMGPSRGGLTSKVHAVVDRRGRPVVLELSAGNIADSIKAPDLFRQLKPAQCSTMLGDKGYDSDALRIQLYELGIFPCLPATSWRKETRPFHKGYYRHRHRVENFFCSLKLHRRIATRYEKLASSFLAFVHLASILIWIR